MAAFCGRCRFLADECECREGPSNIRCAALPENHRPASEIRLRDEFAMAALQGLISSPSNPPRVNGLEVQEVVSKSAYVYADAMLAARESLAARTEQL